MRARPPHRLRAVGRVVVRCRRPSAHGAGHRARAHGVLDPASGQCAPPRTAAVAHLPGGCTVRDLRLAPAPVAGRHHATGRPPRPADRGQRPVGPSVAGRLARRPCAGRHPGGQLRRLARLCGRRARPTPSAWSCCGSSPLCRRSTRPPRWVCVTSARAFATRGAARTCSGPTWSTPQRCCSPSRWRCSPSSPRTSTRNGRSGCCTPRPSSGH